MIIKQALEEDKHRYAIEQSEQNLYSLTLAHELKMSELKYLHSSKRAKGTTEMLKNSIGLVDAIQTAFSEIGYLIKG